MATQTASDNLSRPLKVFSIASLSFLDLNLLIYCSILYFCWNLPVVWNYNSSRFRSLTVSFANLTVFHSEIFFADITLSSKDEVSRAWVPQQIMSKAREGFRQPWVVNHDLQRRNTIIPLYVWEICKPTINLQFFVASLSCCYSFYIYEFILKIRSLSF